MASPCVRHGCSLCCHDTEMPLSRGDVARLEAAGHRREDFTVTVEGETRLANVPFAESGERPAPAAAAAGATGACVFLKGGRCTVYAHRPAGCRSYPVVWDADRDAATRDADCPHAGEFPLGPGEASRVKRLVKRLRDEWAQ